MLKNKNTLCKWTSLFEKPLFKLQNLECFRFYTHYSLICVLYLINRYGSVSDHLTFKGRVCSSSKTGFVFTRNKIRFFFFWNYIGAPHRGSIVFYSQGYFFSFETTLELPTEVPLYFTLKVCNLWSLLFVIESGRKLTTGGKFEVNVMKWGRGSCVCFLYLKFLWYINGIQFELLTDWLIYWLIDWCLTPTLAIFQLYHGVNC